MSLLKVLCFLLLSSLTLLLRDSIELRPTEPQSFLKADKSLMRLRRRSEGGRSISWTVAQFNGAAAMWVRVRRLVRTRYLRHLYGLHTQALTIAL